MRRGRRWVPPCPGQKAYLYLGQGQASVGIVGGDPCPASQREFHAQAHAGTGNGRHERFGAGLEAIEQGMAPFDKRPEIARFFGPERLDVRTGHKILLGADKDGGPHRIVCLNVV